MHSAERNRGGDQESDDEELSENEQKNLENILVLFPYRKVGENTQLVDDSTFEKIKSALSCRICLEVYKEPVYTKDCMHRFCKQCIEKIIRSQQNKSCPFCRTPLGSKRVLRNDNVTEQIINKIFPDLKNYLSMEAEQDNQIYLRKIRELQDNTKVSRNKPSKTGESSPTGGSGTKSTFTPTGGRNKKPKIRNLTEEFPQEALQTSEKSAKEKKAKGKLKRPVVNDLADPVAKTEDTMTTMQEEENKDTNEFENHAQKLIQDVHNDESLLANINKIMDRPDITEIIMSLDFLIPVILEPLPSESYLKQLENPVVKTTSAIKVEQLTKYICKKLNFNDVKFNERIKIWIRKDSNFEAIDRQMTLKEVGNKYWSHLQRIDWEVYDLIGHVEEYLNKTTKPIQNERVLYYSVYFDDWLGA